MQREQPVALVYLLAVDHDILNRDERELLFYLGVEYLRSESEAGFLEATKTMLRSYGQPEVFRFVVEALMEEPEEECLIWNENLGIMMLDLKTLIDCFDG